MRNLLTAPEGAWVVLFALACSSNGSSDAGSAKGGGDVLSSVGGSAHPTESSGGGSAGGTSAGHSGGATVGVPTSAVGGSTGGSVAAMGGSVESADGGSTALKGGATATSGGKSAESGGARATTGGSTTQGGGSATSGGTSAASGGRTDVTRGGTAPTGGTTGAGGTSSTSGGTPVVPKVSNLVIEPNPNMTISCYVSWTTQVESSSEVQFGVSNYEFRIVDETQVTSHRVLVIGMHPDTKYTIKAVSTNESGSSSAEDSFAAGSLPPEIPVGQLTVGDSSASQAGWTLTNIQAKAGSEGFQAKIPALVVMYDESGIPVWYYIDGTAPDTRGDVSVDLVDNNHILIGPTNAEPPREVDLGGNVVWEGPAQPATMGTGEPLSHYAVKLANGHYVVLRDVTWEEKDIGGGTRIEEITPALDVVWSWNIFEHVMPNLDGPKDWCHGNSVTIDPEVDEFYFSCRFQGLFKIRRTGDQSVIWQMGASIDDPNSGDVTFIPPESRFSDIHDPEIHDDGTILIYDNGGYAIRSGMSSGSTTNYHSRVLEFAVDDDAKEAKLVWEFPGNFDVDSWYTAQWYTPYWGDANRLLNGNILITAGVRGADKITHIFEVRRQDGQVVWEMTLPPDHGSYRAERLSPPPLVQKIK